MNTIQKILTVLMLYFIILCNISSTADAKSTAKDYGKSKYNKTRWQTIKNDYLNTKTDRLIFVKYKTGSKATVEMWKKITKTTEPASNNIASNDNTDALTNEASLYTSKTAWKKIISCKAYVGQNGLNKKRQGDRKTPMGIYNITMAFGRKKSPGTAGISYTKLNKYHYWSAEKATYNTFVDVRTLGRTWMSGEHLISYDPWYNYALAMDYNKKCTYLKGSAIFLHCTGKGRTYTMGCIAVSEKNMKQIVKNTTTHTKIFIYKNK
ncbi:MAG: L,D-transpeptidase family protein [Lachnospiraceae bacterium]|nr:L,D-transpeptidase family protein [Lachnospiraceae bacterium]